jgi:hypothetical protein
MAALLPVAFHGDTLYLVEHEGEPFTPIKPICEAIGLDVTAQQVKIADSKARWASRLIPAVAEDGKKRTMLCLPMRKLGGWLASINGPRVRPEIREKLIAYQNECDDALWRYWTDGHASRPSAAPAPAQALLDLPPAAPPAPRRRDDAHLPGLIPPGWTADKVAGARLRLESASGILAGLQFVKDPQTRRDMLTAAHMQCQDAMLFITVQYSEVGARA